MLAGIAAVRTNPALIAMRWLGELLAAVLAVAGTVAPAVALFGTGFAARFAPLGAACRARDADALAVAVLDLYDAVAAFPGRLAAGVAALAVLWTLALLVYCWFQGGLYGVLVTADRAAGAAAGLGVTAPALPGSAFSLALFATEGRRLIRPYFWFVNLYATALPLVALVVLLPLALVPAPAPGEPPLASLAVAAAVLPFAALATAALAVWYAVGCVEVARGVSVAAASRRALKALLRRPGPVLVLTLLAAGAALAVSGIAAPLGAALAALPRTAALTGGATLAAVQWLAAAAVATAYAGSLVRLMRVTFPDPAGREEAA